MVRYKIKEKKEIEFEPIIIEIILETEKEVKAYLAGSYTSGISNGAELSRKEYMDDVPKEEVYSIYRLLHKPELNDKLKSILQGRKTT